MRPGMVVAAAMLPSVAVQADVATDGTLGQRVVLDDQFVAVPAELGMQSGGNLFHSFERLSVDAGNSVRFIGPDTIERVIGRVTGSERTTIEGILANDIPGADLWLFNPQGFFVGPSGIVRTDGSLHLSTAQELRFSDGSVFSAVDPGGSSLSVSAPQTFGFLGRSTGSIVFDNSSVTASPGKTVSLSAPTIEFISSDPELGLGAFAAAVQGQVRIAAIAADGSFEPQNGDASADVRGDIVLRDGGGLSVRGDGAGSITVFAGELEIGDAAAISSFNNGATDAAGSIEIDVERLVMRDGDIRTSGFEQGRASSIAIRAGQIEMFDFSEIGSLADGGDAGDISIEGGTLIAENFSQVRSRTINDGASGDIQIEVDRLSASDAGGVDTSTSTSARGGDLTILANAIVLDGGSLRSETKIGVGDAGTLTIRTGSLELSNFAAVSSNTNSAGNAGSVDISADTIRIFNDGDQSSRISSEAGGLSSGSGGEVRIDARLIQLEDGGLITTGTSGSGPGGRIVIDAGDIELSGFGGISSDSFRFLEPGGDAGSIELTATNLTISSRAKISTNTNNPGNAGTIAIDVDNLTIDGIGDELKLTGVQAGTSDSGAGGQISIDAEVATLLNNGRISSESLGTGDAGELAIRFGHLTLNSGALISSNSIAPGNAGNIRLIGESLALDGRSIEVSIGSSSGNEFSRSGTIDIRTSTMEMTGARIGTDTNSNGDAGAINIRSTDILLNGAASITSNTRFNQGRAGEIDIAAANLSMEGAEADNLIATSSIDGAAGDAGLVRIDVDRLKISGQSEIASSTSGQGNAGRVIVDAAALDLLAGGTISTTTTGSGAAGQIDILGGEVVLVGANLLGSSRIASATTDFSSGSAGSIRIDAGEVKLRNGATISSSSLGSGPAGSIDIRARDAIVDEALIQTAGSGAQGGRIDLVADDLIFMKQSRMTSNGIRPAAGASLIRLEAPAIALIASRVESLFGNPIAPEDIAIGNSGQALVFGKATIVTADSTIAASTSIDVTGIDTEFGSGLQLPGSVLVDTEGLIANACRIGRVDAGSSFVRDGLNRLPASPDDALKIGKIGHAASACPERYYAPDPA